MDDIADEVPDGAERVALGDLLRRIGMRGFGPVLILASGLLILPVGMIPGVPGAIAILIGLVAIELLSGGKALRLPGRLARMTLPATLVAAAVKRSRPVTRAIGRLLRPRATVLATARVAQIGLGLVLGAIAILLFAVGFVPGLPFLLAVPVLLLGLGMTARDGLVLSIGLAGAVAPAIFLVRTFG